MRAVKISLSIIGLQFLALVGSVSAAAPAGTASLVAGSVSAIGLNGEARKLSRDDAVYSGDRILTGSGSYVRMGFVDGSSMMLRPNTEFAIESFRFSPDVVDTAVKVVPPKADAPVPVPALQIADQGSVGNQSFFRLVRGGFRAVSGLVGRINREEYLVRTPVATMGIRGTVFWSVFCDAVCAADPLVLKSLPGGESAIGGTISAVDQGSIVLVSNAGQTATLNASQFLLTTASGVHVSLPALPGFLAAEGWMSVAQQAAGAPTTPAAAAAPAAATGTTSALMNTVISTAPVASSLAAALAVGITVMATDMEDGGNTSTSTVSTTSTSNRN